MIRHYPKTGKRRKFVISDSFIHSLIPSFVHSFVFSLIDCDTHLTLFRVSAGTSGPGVGLRFRGLPGPRRAGFLEVSSFL